MAGGDLSHCHLSWLAESKSRVFFWYDKRDFALKTIHSGPLVTVERCSDKSSNSMGAEVVCTS